MLGLISLLLLFAVWKLQNIFLLLSAVMFCDCFAYDLIKILHTHFRASGFCCTCIMLKGDGGDGIQITRGEGSLNAVQIMMGG